MEKLNKAIVACVIPGLLFSTGMNGQNLLVNGDFEANGGSFDGWFYTPSNTELLTDGNSHYAHLWGENGVLYQRVEGLQTGIPYACTIHFRYLKVKQTTGYGYAVEEGVPLTIPTFTIGATNLKNFCEANGGQWTILPDNLEESNTEKTWFITLPQTATALYICTGTKGALADYKIDSVTLSVPETGEVLFRVAEKTSGNPVEGARISVQGMGFTYVTDASGEVTAGLMKRPQAYSFQVQREWYESYASSFTLEDDNIELNIHLDSIREVKKVVTRISKYSDNETPYPIFGHMWNSGMNYTTILSEMIVGALDYIIGGVGVPDNSGIVDQLHAIDPRFQVIKYQGGWNASRTRAEARKMDLQYYRCGVLAASLDASAQTFQVNAPSDGKGIGLVPSEEGNFNTWIRIGNELMKLVSVSSQSTYPITVTVERGYSGTQSVSHDPGAAVTAPLYTTPPVPGGNNSGLSYFATVFDFRKTELKQNTLDLVTNNHQDGIWIDILVGWLGAKSMTGGNYTLWDHRDETLLSNEEIIRYTKDAIQEIYYGFYALKGFYPVIYGNNVLYSNTLTPADRGYMMVRTEEHGKVIDGFCHENSWGHMSDDPSNIDNDGEPIPDNNKIIIMGDNGHYLEWFVNDSWISNCRAIALLAQSRLPNQAMTINAGFKNQWFAGDLTEETRYAFNKYAYASYLLCVDVAPDSSISCRMGISAQAKINNNLTVQIDSFFYRPVGIPLEQYPAISFTSYRVGNHNLYARRFSNGVVLINPTKNDMSNPVLLSEITGNDSLYYDPETGPAAVTGVQLKSRESLILLKSPEQPVNSVTWTADPAIRVELFPVPAQNKLTIRVQTKYLYSNMIEVRLYSVAGLVNSQDLDFSGGQAELDISDLKPGVYLVKLMGLYGVARLVVQ